MTSLPPIPLKDILGEIDTLPDGAVISSEIDASSSGEGVFADPHDLPVRQRKFDEETTRKAHAPKPAKTRESNEIDLSSWDSFRRRRDDEPV